MTLKRGFHESHSSWTWPGSYVFLSRKVDDVLSGLGLKCLSLRIDDIDN